MQRVIIQPAAPVQVGVFMSFRRLQSELVWEDETWTQVSARLTEAYEIPSWSLFQKVPVDGQVIIIIHLLGLAPAGYLAAPDNGPEGRLCGGACQVPIRSDGCHAVPLNLLSRVW
jgi:hypothetical protein